MKKVIVRQVGKEKGDGFSAYRGAGSVCCRGKNPLSVCFGENFLKTVVKSGHVSDFMGDHVPRFPLRPVWLQSRVQPAALKRIAECGYNSVIFSEPDDLPAIKEQGLQAVFHLKGELKPDFSPDLLFVEGSYFPPKSDRNRLQIEQVAEEMKRFEKGGFPLIYYSPVPDPAEAKQQSKWLAALCDEAGQETTIAFSALAGHHMADHLPAHPFWQELRFSPDESATPLMPIFNFGSVKQGEGLWPVATYDLIDHYFPRMRRHHFAGAIACFKGISENKAFLDCALWTAGTAQWFPFSGEMLAESWFSAHRPDLDFSGNQLMLAEIRDAAKQLSLLRTMTFEKSRDRFSTGQCRALAEALVARLASLEAQMPPALSRYYRYFHRDARRIILHFAQCFNVGVPNLPSSSDHEPAFWTGFSRGVGQGVRTGGQVTFLEEPDRGEPDSEMAKTFAELC